ncbi:GNAT family N-acetyltransferase [Streptantibioticus parmotrematis]|uniref:GNAT family N-acetyltransferase n=1 Tax=Streptantibioticus parmotrematis TaxID=2873249 RepID=UPI0033C11015
MLLRPLRDTLDDAKAVTQVADEAFAASRAARGRPPRTATERERAMGRALFRHLARTDGGGCWTAWDDEGTPVGAVLSTRREGTWALSLIAVVPRLQRQGVARELLAAAMTYGRSCLRGMICAPSDPRPAAMYRAAGFTLHPTMRLSGPVDRDRLPAPDGPVHEGTVKHRDLMDSVDRRLRGGAHGPDHDELLRHHGLLVVDDLAGSGYVYLHESGTVELLAATSRRLASRLLTAALLAVPRGTDARVGFLTADQQWAVDVGLAAGLTPANSGYLCLRGMRPPAPYVPSGTFL